MYIPNPLVILYGAQALTYFVAAMLYRRAGHRDLAACYGASAALHSAMAATHMLVTI